MVLSGSGVLRHEEVEGNAALRSANGHWCTGPAVAAVRIGRIHGETEFHESRNSVLIRVIGDSDGAVQSAPAAVSVATRENASRATAEFCGQPGFAISPE